MGYFFGNCSCHCDAGCTDCDDLWCCRHMSLTLGGAGACNRTDTFDFPGAAELFLFSAMCGAYGPDGETGWLLAYDICEWQECGGAPGKVGYWEAFVPLVQIGEHCCPEVGPVNWVCLTEGGCDGMTLEGEMIAGPLDWEDTTCLYCEYCQEISEEDLEADQQCQAFITVHDAAVADPCGAEADLLRATFPICTDLPDCEPP